jgi:Ca-activated chloride channel family protein
LIGYETRMLERTDFNNDAVDAGDIGSGHTVTAIYEVTPVGSPAQLADPLRYPQGAAPAPSPSTSGAEYAFVKIRYKLPEENTSRLITRPVNDQDVQRDFSRLPTDLRFAAAVAGAGQLLRRDSYVKNFGYDRVIEIASNARGADPYGHRGEFVALLRRAKDAAAMKPLDPANPGS